MDSLTAAINSNEAATIFEGVVKKIIEFAIKRAEPKVDSFVTQLENAKKASLLGERIGATINVKTIWNYAQPVSLYEFYDPPSLEFFDRRAQVIGGLNDFARRFKCAPPNEDKYEPANYVIQGTVGQGKSIFLRYLWGQEFKKTNTTDRIPVFVELKRIHDSNSLQDIIFEAIRNLDFKVDDELFDVYAKSGGLVLLLDGFDEIEQQHVRASIEYLEKLVKKYGDLQIFITARPGSDIQRSTLFHVVKLSPLNPKDHPRFLACVCKDEAQVKKILEAIRDSSVEIQNLLGTPLLMTLMVLLYGAHEKIPKTVPLFYHELFDMLFYRHDNAKPGFTRHRYTSLNDQEVRRLFEAFCFHVRARQVTQISSSSFSECVNAAMDTCGYKVDVRAFRDELTKVACLLQEDGVNLSFIHKSVSEFYAAEFVRHSSPDVQSKFYKALLNMRTWVNWRQELKFLEETDRSRFLSDFLLPSARSVFSDLRIDINTGRVNFYSAEAKSVLDRVRFNGSSFVSDADNNFAKEEFQSSLGLDFERRIASVEARKAEVAIRMETLRWSKDARLSDMTDNFALGEIARASYESVSLAFFLLIKEAREYLESEKRKGISISELLCKGS